VSCHSPASSRYERTTVTLYIGPLEVSFFQIVALMLRWRTRSREHPALRPAAAAAANIREEYNGNFHGELPLLLHDIQAPLAEAGVVSPSMTNA